MSPTSKTDFMLRLGVMATLLSVLALAAYVCLMQFAVYFEKAYAGIFAR